MVHPVWKGIVLVVATAVVALGSGVLLLKLSGRKAVEGMLRDRVAKGTVQAVDTVPLHRRFAGYDRSAFVRYWKALDGPVAPGSAETGREIERRFLKMDLVYPFVYGGALVAALLLAWAAGGRPFHPAWLIIPVVALMLADWTENLVLLGQIRRFEAGGEGALREGWIQVASAATRLKIVLLWGCGILVVAITFWPFHRARAVNPVIPPQ